MSGELTSTGFKGGNRMNTGYKGKSNEELVGMFKAGDQEAFNALMEATEPLRYKVAQSFLNIPNSELEDLMQEGAILMSKAAIAYIPDGGAAFTTYLYSRLQKLYSDIFRAETAEKRNPHGMLMSFDQMDANSEYGEDEGNSLGNEFFSVECEDYSMIEIRETLKALSLSGNETIAIQMLIEGKSKPEIAKALKVKTPTVHSYVKRAGEKMKMCGAFA